MKKVFVLLMVMALGLLAGCAGVTGTDGKGTGAIHGALTGGAIGAAVSSPTLVGMAVGIPVGATIGLVAGDLVDRQGPMFYTDQCNGTKCMDVVGKPFQLDPQSDEWYVVLMKDDQLTIAKKPLKANKWTTVKDFKK